MYPLSGKNVCISIFRNYKVVPGIGMDEKLSGNCPGQVVRFWISNVDELTIEHKWE